MGEMADMYAWGDESMWNEPEPRWHHRQRKRNETPKCKYCGEGDLQWFHTTELKWRLYNFEGKLHECPHPTVGKRK